MIDAELIDEKIKLLEAQKEQHFALFNQAVGAISVLEYLKTVKPKEPADG